MEQRSPTGNYLVLMKVKKKKKIYKIEIQNNHHFTFYETNVDITDYASSSYAASLRSHLDEALNKYHN